MIGDVAHICNRGVDKRRIFSNREDYQRFRDNLLLLNNIGGKIRTRHENIFSPETNLPEREKLVEVLKWSLMPNHFHLLLYEATEGGILEFVKRVGNAYTKYFNIKNNKRSGYLFQDHAKIITMYDERHLSYIPIYIDLNSSDLISKDVKNKMEFIKSYEWSSVKNYFGDYYDDKVINKELFYKTFGVKFQRYEEDLRGFMSERERLEKELEVLGVDVSG